MREIAPDEKERLIDELDEMIADGTAEILCWDDKMLVIRRADGSGVIFTAGGLIANVRRMVSLGDDAGPDDILKIFGAINDRKPTGEADEILGQVFGPLPQDESE